MKHVGKVGNLWEEVGRNGRAVGEVGGLRLKLRRSGNVV